MIVYECKEGISGTEQNLVHAAL